MVKSSSKKSNDECHDYQSAASSSSSSSSSGCIGISMAAVLNAIVSSPSYPEEEGGDSSKSPFHRLKSVVQKTLNSPCRGQHNVDTHMSYDYDYDDDRELVYDKNDLMQRATSYNTNGTEPTVDSSTKQNDTSQVKVQFHHPLITSVRLRPKTRLEDVEKLYFAPEELDEIEYDRDETRYTDDIETMAVDSRSYDEQGSVGRGTREERKHRGVQILLREKSTR